MKPPVNNRSLPRTAVRRAFLVRACVLFVVSVVVLDGSPIAAQSASSQTRTLTSRRASSASNTPGITPAVGVDVLLHGDWHRGLRLIQSHSESLLITRDGWLHTVPRSEEGSRIRVTNRAFSAIPASELRQRLRAEFGSRFEVVATKHFLVVQPRGRGKRWPDMFERCHRSFVGTMDDLGVHVRKGRFPMVAVVFPDARAMYQEFDRLDISVGRVSGLYANRCNRVMTHDGGHLQQIAATVRHEAAHQSAFNTGVHSRVNDTPSWLSEGLGQLFEPASMAEGHAGSTLTQRINRESMQHIASKFSLRSPSELAPFLDQLIAGDAMFQNPSTVHTAYSISWAMVFYLTERNRKALADMLNHTASRSPFEDYRAGQRRIDFQRLVGDPAAFSIELTRFLSRLK